MGLERWVGPDCLWPCRSDKRAWTPSCKFWSVWCDPYEEKLWERPSRWQRSKTWRSPSSSQIHQKYIYMWNNSYRTPTERWQKTSDFPKGKKLPKYLGRAKEKRKNRDKRIGTGPAPLGGSCEGGKVSTHWQRWGVGGGELRSQGGERSNRGAEGKAERFPTEDRCQPVPTSPRGLSAHPLGWVGAGSWGSGFGGQIPGRGLGLAEWTQPEGG